MASIKNITQNAFEDGTEDFISTYIYRRMKSVTDPLKKEFNGESEFDEAMQSFIQTLTIGLQMYAIQKVMSFFFERGTKYLGAMFSYIVAGKITTKLTQKFKNTNKFGNRLFKNLGLFLGLDRTSERIEMMKIVQSNVDNYDKHKMHYETLNNSVQNRLDTFSSSVSGYKGTKDLKTMTIFNDLTSRGVWNNTKQHKDIYEKATGYDLSNSGVIWSNLYKELNKYTQYAKTANDEILNLTESINKLVATKGS